MRIMVVEDNEDAGTTLVYVLRALGHTVTHVLSGEAAIEQATELKPAVVIMDLGLPGIQGHEAARRLLSLPEQKMVIVVVSGWGREDDRERSRAAGAAYHLVKPVDFEQLKAILKSFSDSVAE